MLKNFYIFRNGESSYNVDDKLQGQSNHSVLTDKGISQAFNTAKFLKDKKIEVIISSPQRRAKQTGTIVAKQLNTSLQFDSRLVEANLGSIDGTKLDKLSKQNQEILALWQNKSTTSNPRFKNGESKSEVRTRILSALNEYANKEFTNIAISSHNFPIIEALQYVDTNKNTINNGEIVHLQYNGTNWKFIQPIN